MCIRVGFGMCIRDDEGGFVLAKIMWSSPICNVDSKKVVDYFHKDQNDATEFGDMLKECKRMFNLYFENFHVEYDMRQTNEAAHTLARVAISMASSNIFIDVPTCINHIIMNEMI
jgi:hypothetical protein